MCMHTSNDNCTRKVHMCEALGHQHFVANGTCVRTIWRWGSSMDMIDVVLLWSKVDKLLLNGCCQAPVCNLLHECAMDMNAP